jgi:hypothetical protein
MKKIIGILAILSLCSSCYPQATYAKYESYPAAIGGSTLYGDLKHYIQVEELKTKEKVIITSDELYVKFMNKFKSRALGVNIKFGKKDRMGFYTEYWVYLKKEYKPEIDQFIKSL